MSYYHLLYIAVGCLVFIAISILIILIAVAYPKISSIQRKKRAGFIRSIVVDELHHGKDFFELIDRVQKIENRLPEK